MSDPVKPADAIPAYGEDDEAKSLAKQTGAAPAAPAPATPPVKAAGTTETDVGKNVAEATARAAAKPA